jgi:hypothetical protein
MSLFCADGSRGEFARRPPAQPPERVAGKAVWRPPDRTLDQCARCGEVAMDHRVERPEVGA